MTIFDEPTFIVYNLFHMPEENTAAASSQTIPYPEEASREMIEAGVFYGRKKSKTNPKMRQFILVSRGGIEIINLAKTMEAMDKALAFLEEKVRNGGLVLLLGTEPAAEEGVAKLAAKFKLPYVTNRWAGGTLTNFKVVSKRIEYMKKLRADFASGALEKYTKKERLELDKELRRLGELFGGLESLTKEPDVLVVIDPNLHNTAVREANRMKIPVIALANLDAEPDELDYLVPGNNKAKKSIEWFLGKIERALAEGFAQKTQTDKILKEKEEAAAAAATKSSANGN
jgi:small subunit ribosomal protein S2